MSIKFFVPTLVLGMFLLSPLLASADETRYWVLWWEVENPAAIQYPNSQNPSTHFPFAEASAISVFSSRKVCEKERSKMAEEQPSFSKGWPYLYICLPDRVRPFYFGR